jgi:hypothetical protein
MAYLAFGSLCLLPGCIRMVGGERQMHEIFRHETFDSLEAFTTSFAATPCSFAATHHVKGLSLNVGENAFAEVQKKLNALADNCAKETETDARIAALEASIKDAENKIAQAQAAVPEIKTKKEQYEAEQKITEVSDATCSDAISKAGVVASAGRGVSNFFGGIGHHLGGVFKSSEEKQARADARKKQQEEEEAELEKTKKLAEKCEIRNGFVKDLAKNDKILSEQAVRKVKDEAEWAKQKETMNQAKVAVSTNTQGVISELQALQTSVNDAFGIAQVTNNEEPLSRDEPLSPPSPLDVVEAPAPTLEHVTSNTIAPVGEAPSPPPPSPPPSDEASDLSDAEAEQTTTAPTV